ncbi:MAG: small, acid-soluble spore protein, alpha/beta type [Bacillota bacterium]
MSSSDMKGKQTRKKANVKRKPKGPTVRDLMKLEIADELGLLTKVRSVGWEGLTAQEAGAIGGIMSHRLRRQGIAGADKKALPAKQE